MAPWQTGQLSVLAVDEDKDHANYMRSILPQFNFHVRVYTSPRSTLNFLKDNAQDVDFLLVAVSMDEMSGFQFLEIATKMHRNIQAILMSTETTLDIFRKAVNLGARFVVKKPLDDITMRNMWQHIDLSVTQRMAIIQRLYQGPTGKQSAQSGAESVVTDSSGGHSAAEAESISHKSGSELQASSGSNTAVEETMVHYPASEDGETMEKGCEGDNL